MKISFGELKEKLKPNLRYFISDLVPGGRISGNEYIAADIHGGAGRSFSINLETGIWCDFSKNQKGGDIIALKAAQDGCSQIEAARYFLKYIPNLSSLPKNPPPKPKPAVQEPEKNEPDMIHEVDYSKIPPPVLGRHNGFWKYFYEDGSLAFYIARYEKEDGGKFYCPFSWDGKQWIKKMPPEIRPLYNIDDVKKNKNILIVEGEKACDAAKKIVGNKYACTTWSNGAQAWKKSDWNILKDKNVLFWADADDAGITAAKEICEHLNEICDDVKYLNTIGAVEKGFDAADALSAGWDWDKFYQWAVPLAVKLESDPEPETVSIPEPEPQTEVIQKPKDYVHSLNMMGLGIKIVDVDILTSDQYEICQKLGLATLQSTGNPHASVDNCIRVLQGLQDYNGNIWYDEFIQKVLTTIPRNQNDTSRTVRQWTENDDRNILKFMQRNFGMQSLKLNTVSVATQNFAFDDIRNEPKEWLESIEWDNTNRINNFFCEYMGAQDSEYTRAVSKNFWISMVARIFRPGCQVDNMVVLEGKQGIFKTSALRTIGGKWHAEAQDQVTSKDFFQALQGKMLLEIGEFSSFPRHEILKIKQVVSCPSDRYRGSYERYVVDHPRQCIFVATTNDKKYLHDSTGGRRFWPIECGKIKLDDIKRDRNQLFAEAVHMLNSNENWYKTPAEETKRIQEERRMSDAWENIISDYLRIHIETKIYDIAEHIGIDKSKLDMNTQRRISNILTMQGWKYKNGAWRRNADLNQTPDF